MCMAKGGIGALEDGDGFRRGTDMTEDGDTPQIYLITPPVLSDGFGDTLAACLDAVPVGCVRLALASADETEIARAADAMREVCHARDVALVIEAHVRMVERLGLDGVHLMDAGRAVGRVRADLGEDAIIGAGCGVSRHDGMLAGEMGADYVSFGPVGETSLGDGARAQDELFAWWSEMIEVPCVAEGALDEALVRALAGRVDFFGFGGEIWGADDPARALRRMAAAMAG